MSRTERSIADLRANSKRLLDVVQRRALLAYKGGVQASDGNIYYAHRNDYVGGARSVVAGEAIGHVGNTGDASDAPPHLHFEMRLGGPNGYRTNPYPTVRAHC